MWVVGRLQVQLLHLVVQGGLTSDGGGRVVGGLGLGRLGGIAGLHMVIDRKKEGDTRVSAVSFYCIL